MNARGSVVVLGTRSDVSRNPFRTNDISMVDGLPAFGKACASVSASVRNPTGAVACSRTIVTALVSATLTFTGPVSSHRPPCTSVASLTTTSSRTTSSGLSSRRSTSWKSHRASARTTGR